jgi:glycosyltransferase 2 family protein
VRRKWFIFFVLCLLAGIVAYRLAAGKFDWSLFFATIRDLHWGWISASIAATVISFLLRAVRWQELLSPIKKIGLGSLFATTILGFSAIFILGRAGELFRPIWLARRENISMTASFATIIVERVLDSVMLIGLFAWALLTVVVPPESMRILALMKQVAWLSTAVSVGAIVFLFVLRSNVDRVVRLVPIPRVATLLKDFGDGLTFLKSGRSLGLILFHSVVMWGVVAIQMWLTLRGMHFNVTVSASALVMVGAAIGSLAQIPGIGGGFQVAVAFCLTTFVGVPSERALAAGLISWLTGNLPVIATAIPCMFGQGLKFGDIRNLTRNPQSESL